MRQGDVSYSMEITAYLMLVHWVYEMEDIILMEDLASMLRGMYNRFLDTWGHLTEYVDSPDFKELLSEKFIINFAHGMTHFFSFFPHKTWLPE